MLTLILPDGLRAQLECEARAAFPEECCGLIEGERAGDVVRSLALHPTKNVADDPASGFEIDPVAHIRLRCALRGTGREVVGCYHSHPNGRPTPSDRDRANPGEDGFVWLIAAVAHDVTIAAFAAGALSPVTLQAEAGISPR